MSQRHITEIAEVYYHSRSKVEPNTTHYKNKYYFEFINESKVFLLIYNSGIIKSIE